MKQYDNLGHFVADGSESELAAVFQNDEGEGVCVSFEGAGVVEVAEKAGLYAFAAFGATHLLVWVHGTAPNHSYGPITVKIKAVAEATL